MLKSAKKRKIDDCEKSLASTSSTDTNTLFIVQRIFFSELIDYHTVLKRPGSPTGSGTLCHHSRSTS